MDGNDVELRLLRLRHQVSSGEIRLRDLAPLADALQELSTRIARLVVGQEGPGRTLEVGAEAAELRLTDIRDGSTRLTVGYGGQPTLSDPDDILAGVQNETTERFWQVLDGLAHNSRPPWVTSAVAASGMKLVGALANAAESVVVSGSSMRNRAPVSLNHLARLDLTTWGDEPLPEAQEHMVVSGVLYAVNLETGRLAVRDDVGTSIPLVRVENLEDATTLIGQRVSAQGKPLRGGRDELRLDGALLVPAPLPETWVTRVPDTLAEILQTAASRPGPDPAGIPDLTDDDMDRFFALIDE